VTTDNAADLDQNPSEVDPAPVKPKPRKKRKPHRKPKAPTVSDPQSWFSLKSWSSSIDWYLVGLLFLGAITLAPYIVKFTQFVVPAVIVPVANFDASAAKVPEWLGLVGTEKNTGAPAFAESLRTIAAGCKSGAITSSDVLWDKLHEEFAAKTDEVAWADWSLFAREIFSEAKALKQAGKITTINRDVAAYFEAIAKALDEVK
jgi:hypothetical protein